MNDPVYSPGEYTACRDILTIYFPGSAFDLTGYYGTSY